MSAEQQLAILPAKEVALAVFSAPNGLDPYLQSVREEIDRFNASAPDVTTKKGQAAYRSIAYDLAGSKTKLDNLGKELVAELKDVPKKIDAERKRVRELLSTWQEEVRKPLTDWEAAETARKDRHVDAVQAIEDLTDDLGTLTASELLDGITAAEAIQIGKHWEEFEAEAARTKDHVLTKLRAALSARRQHEAELAEIAKFNAEKAEREQQERDAAIAREAVEKAQREADQRAQAERDAAAKREQDLIDQAANAQRAAEQAARDAAAAAENQRLQLQLQAEQAERAAVQAKADQQAAEQRAAQQKADDEERNRQAIANAEASRIAAEQRAEQERINSEARQAEAAERARLAEVDRQKAAADEIIRQAAAREADKAHKMKINRAALDAFVTGGMTEECAKQAITLIAKRQIPAIQITY